MKILPNTKLKVEISYNIFNNIDDPYCCFHYYNVNTGEWINSSPSFKNEMLEEYLDNFKKTGKILEYSKVEKPGPGKSANIQLHKL